VLRSVAAAFPLIVRERLLRDILFKPRLLLKVWSRPAADPDGERGIFPVTYRQQVFFYAGGLIFTRQLTSPEHRDSKMLPGSNDLLAT
jgi:hypothetical protein